MSTPQALYVGDDSVQAYTAESMDDILRDPRGLLLMFEKPKRNTKYIMGLDASEGITGWSRGSRTDNDHKTDNGAIEIFEVDAVVEAVMRQVPNPSGRGYIEVPYLDAATGNIKKLFRDLQVAEYAAPCDAVEIARVANILGRIYAGDADDQCELIWEAYPGCGMLTTQELIRLKYGNLWMWEHIDSVAEETNRMGWHSSRESQKLLWYRARRHLMGRQAKIQSKYLLSEYANAEIDLDKMRARAAYGFHDDRFQAANMCFWAGHKWTYEVDREPTAVREDKVVDFQRRAQTLDDYVSYKEYRDSFTDDWLE